DWFNMLTEKNWDFGQFLINAATTELERFPEFTRIANNVGMLCMASWTVSNSLHSWHALRDAFEQENIYVWLGETKDEVIFRLSFAPYVTRNDLQKAVAVCERWRNGEFS
ncbi:MAG: hypothetical protein Q4P05_05645, partial [Actinomycetaceae bacterium]|nr:hypothetical protein [Actinomycetaceae bacterium]